MQQGFMRLETEICKTPMRLRTLFGFCLLLLLPSSVLKAQVRFYANAEKSVPVNYQFQVNFTLENGDGKNFVPPSFSDFQVVNGPSVSNSVQIVNNSYSKSVTYSYVLKPKREGTAKIGKAKINVAGAEMESNELQIQITAPAQAQRQQRQRSPFGWDPFADPFEEEEPEPAANSADLEKQLRENVFMRMVVDKSSVFLGEQLTATLRLYYRLNFGQTQLSKTPTFDGFWSQEIQFAQNQNPRGTETINGVQYYTIDVQKFNLFPQRSGELSVSPAEMDMIVQIQVQRKSRSIWDDFFGNAGIQQIPFKARSPELKIQVKEPPMQGRPESYNGAVGSLDFKVSLSSSEGKVDEPVTYSVKISGKGNLKNITVPAPELPADFEVYEPRIKENISNTGSGLSGSIQYDYLLIPRQPGEYNISALEFAWFDPSSRSYRSARSEAYTLQITGAPSQAGVPVSGSNKRQEVKTLGKDIRYLKSTMGEAVQQQRSITSSPAFWSLYCSPLFLFFALLGWRKRQNRLNADLVGSRRRRANKMALKRLAAAKKHLSAADRKAFYDELSRSLWGYSADKLGMEAASLNRETLGEKLREKNVAEDLRNSLLSCIEQAEFALFAPGDGQQAMEKHYEQAYQIITKLEDALAA